MEPSTRRGAAIATRTIHHVGYPAVVVGVIGVFFSVAATRSLIASPSTGPWRGRHLPLTVWLLVIFAVQLGAGIALLVHPRTGPLDLISDVLVLSLIIGIARAWELVGGRGTGVIASLTALIDDRRTPDPARADPPEATDSEAHGKVPAFGLRLTRADKRRHGASVPFQRPANG